VTHSSLSLLRAGLVSLGSAQAFKALLELRKGRRPAWRAHLDEVVPSLVGLISSVVIAELAARRHAIQAREGLPRDRSATGGPQTVPTSADD
jgi:hypothetical protein